MTPKRLFYGLIAMLFLTVSGSVGAVWFANSWLEDTSQTLIDKKLELVALSERQQQSFEAQNTLAKYEDIRDAVSAVAPTEKQQEKIIAELYRIASENNLTIRSLNFPSSNLGEVKKAAPAAAAPTSGAQANDTPAAAPAAAPAATPAAAPTSQISQTEKVDGITGVLGLKITPSEITENGFTQGMSYATLLNFLESLERNRRQMIVNEVAIEPIGETGAYNLTLSLTALIDQ